MDFKRAQVTAALTALGLDPDLTASVVIGPTNVYVEVAQLVDGHPVVENGALRLDTSSTPITEQEVQG